MSNLALGAAAIGGIIFTVLLMFLPAFIELRKPRDAGPREISENITAPKLLKPLPSLINMETEFQIIDLIRFIPNMESVFFE